MNKKLFLLFKKAVVYLEDSKKPWFYFFLSFVFVVALRNFLEIFSGKMKTVTPEAIFHYSFFYLALALTAVLLSFIITREKINKIAKVVFPCFLVIVLVPLFDLLFSGGKGHDIVYLSPDNSANLLIKFFTFLGGYGGAGLSPGMRIEIILVLIFFLAYFYLKTNKIFRSLAGVFFIYALFFLYNITPVILSSFFSFFHLKYLNSNYLFLQAYLLNIFIIALILFLLQANKFLKEFFSNINFFKLLLAEFVFISGVVFALTRVKFVLNSANFFAFFLIPISIAFAWFFVAVYDFLSRKSVVLAKKKTLYHSLSLLFLAISLLYSWAVGFEISFLILVWAGNFFLFHTPPLRLKRIPILAEILISLNALILFMAGFILITAGSFLDFPVSCWSVFLIGLTFVLAVYNFKNYKKFLK